jgi:MoaD family protein
MRIRFRGYLTLKDVLGDRWLELGGPDPWTVRDVIQYLSGEAGDEWAGKFLEPLAIRDRARPITILVNGRHCSHLPRGLDTLLADGDEVAIFPPAAGG